MCLLVAKPKGVEIEDVDDLCEQAHDSNKDGFGMAVRQNNGRIKIVKGMFTVKEQVALVNMIEKREAILHWRWGTAGQKSKLNCHPFKIDDGTVFAHNGVMQIQSDPGLSDTHTVARSVTNLEDLLKVLDEHVGVYNSNKFAVMHPEYKLHIMGEDGGTWDKGVWYSNTHWRKRTHMGFHSGGSCGTCSSKNYSSTPTHSSGVSTPRLPAPTTTTTKTWDKDLDDMVEELIRVYGYHEVKESVEMNQYVSGFVSQPSTQRTGWWNSEMYD